MLAAVHTWFPTEYRLLNQFRKGATLIRAAALNRSFTVRVVYNMLYMIFVYRYKFSYSRCPYYTVFFVGNVKKNSKGTVFRLLS